MAQNRRWPNQIFTTIDIKKQLNCQLIIQNVVENIAPEFF